MIVKRPKRNHPNLYINIAPLVEVMLVLIIIFMITAPMLNVCVNVNLPKTSAATFEDSQTKPVVISIDKDANLYLEESPISIDELLNKLPVILAAKKGEAVYVRGDKDLPYGNIMALMGIISSLGGCKVSLIADALNNEQLTVASLNLQKSHRDY
jgi:biopolymer transport protein TolR